MKKKNKKNTILKEKNLCPVCRRYHFSYPNSFEICPICGFENELLAIREPDFTGGANILSLIETRKAFNEKK